MNKKLLPVGLMMAVSCSIAHGQLVGWYELGTGANALNVTQELQALVASPLGDVYVAGPQNSAGGYIARWNGTNWSGTGTGVNALNANGVVRTLGADVAGNIYAAGDFTNVDSKLRVAKWNGSAWTDLDPNSLDGNSSGPIFTLHAAAPDRVYVAGDLQHTSAPTRYVARWNGTSWAELGTGANALNANNSIMAVCTDATGNVYAAGSFTNSAAKCYVAKWNGTSWAELGTGTNALNADQTIYSLCTDAAGNVYAAGAFKNSSGKYYVAKWNGTSWSELGSGAGALVTNTPVAELCINAAGNLYTSVLTEGSFRVARWDGSVWAELGTGLGRLSVGPIFALHVTPSGKAYAGGDFGYGTKKYVAAYDGVNGPRVDSVTVQTAGSAPATITAAGGTLDVTSGVYPFSVNDSVTWSIVPVTGTASIPTSSRSRATVRALSNGTVWIKAVSVVDPSKKDSLLITIGTPVGIQGLEESIALKIYPNPVKDVIHIEAGRDHPELSVVLTDGLGRMISSQTFPANGMKKGVVLQSGGLAQGTYYLIFSGKGIGYSYKIVKD